MNDSYVDVTQDGYVATITLSNPPRHTINAAGAEALLVALESLDAQSDVRIVVLTGGSEDIFVRHYEVDELATSAERQIRESRPSRLRSPENRERKRPRGLRGAMDLLESMDAITIAAINGTAMGGGLELALACDFRLSRSGDFRLGLPETGVGILPGGGGTQRFARLLGVAKALDLILHGTVFTPETAHELGIASRVLSTDLTSYRNEVAEFADTLAKRAPRALANAKRAIREGVDLPLQKGLQREAELFGELMRTEDAAKALRAAFEGRPIPGFKGR
ncbi:MAG: enoyl-CoA hydratase/isomerase family protein [Gammaproteobacteria bacterium]|nr:enoyl-CoA hydratase/isomerase family protein [Gammaproteobacteria bacterium]